ncbi:MAG: transglutaminase-like cysteine peptidase [Magnetococcales bacterium]|nr:transglutaminase-like cysteine peptidase [Magnetococcales bacterium]
MGWRSVVCALLVVAGLPLPTSEARDPERDAPLARLFQDSATRADDTGRGEKLARVLRRHAEAKPPAWTEDLAQVRALPVPDRLQAVQERVNRRIRYQDDPRNDWLAPVDAYRDGGDCEDYAIAKMLLLEESGFPEKHLRLVTLDPNRASAVHHVILVAWLQEKMVVLDSPGRTVGDRVAHWEGYRDADRPLNWVGWRGGGVSPDGGGERFVAQGIWGSGGRKILSFREFPLQEKLVRIAADWLVIHPWEPPLTPAEVQRLRLLRAYYHQPTPENARLLSVFEVGKLDALRRIRKAL